MYWILLDSYGQPSYKKYQLIATDLFFVIFCGNFDEFVSFLDWALEMHTLFTNFTEMLTVLGLHRLMSLFYLFSLRFLVDAWDLYLISHLLYSIVYSISVACLLMLLSVLVLSFLSGSVYNLVSSVVEKVSYNISADTLRPIGCLALRL